MPASRSLEQAGACAERMVLEVPGLVACEFIDEAMLRALDHLAPGVLPMNVEAALLIEVEALEEGIDRALAVVVECVEESGGSAREARSDEEIEIAWNARRSAFGALGRMHADSYTHDFATPRDRLVTLAACRGRDRRRATVSCSRRSRTSATATSTLGCTTTRASPGRSSAPWRPARSCS